MMKDTSHFKTLGRISSAPPDEGEPDLKVTEKYNTLADEFWPIWTEKPKTSHKTLRADASEYQPAVKAESVMFPSSAIFEPQQKPLSYNVAPFVFNPTAIDFVINKIERIVENKINAPEDKSDEKPAQIEDEKKESALEIDLITNEEKVEEIRRDQIGEAMEFTEEVKHEEQMSQKVEGLGDEVAVESLPQEEIKETNEHETQIDVPRGRRVYHVEDIKNLKMNFLKDQAFFIVPKAIMDLNARVVEVIRIQRPNNNKKHGAERREVVREVIAKVSWRRAQTVEEKKISEKAKLHSTKLMATPDEQEKIKKQVRITLNKLSPNNQEKLTNEILETCKKSHDYLKFVVSGIFDKAWSEAKYTQMYSNICKFLKSSFEGHIYSGAENSRLEPSKNYFKTELLVMCQETFMKEPESCASEMTEEQKADFIAKNKKKTLGNVRFIGELFNVNLIAANIVLGCTEMLLDAFEKENNEDKLEGACLLLETGAGSFERNKLKSRTDVIYSRIRGYMGIGVSTKNRFKIMNLIEARESGWKNNREQVKKIEDIHADHFYEQNLILKRHGYN